MRPLDTLTLPLSRCELTWKSAESILTKSLEEQPGGNLPSAYAAGLRSTSGIVTQWYRHTLQSTPVSLQKYFTCRQAENHASSLAVSLASQALLADDQNRCVMTPFCSTGDRGYRLPCLLAAMTSA